MRVEQHPDGRHDLRQRTRRHGHARRRGDQGGHGRGVAAVALAQPLAARRLAHAAAQARRSSVRAGEWNVAKSGEGGEEGVEEEDLPRAETEATEAANQLSGAMSALEAYTRAPSAAALARYESKLAHGREVWDESISEIWHLAHGSSPPIV